MAKLTKAQLRILEFTAHPDGLRKNEIAGDDWQRLDRLFDLGLCERRTFDGYTYRITDSGRLALSDGGGNV